MKVKVAQLCPTLCDPMDYTVYGTLQARLLEWVAFPFSRGSSQSRDQTQVSHIAGKFFTSWATREAQSILNLVQFSNRIVFSIKKKDILPFVTTWMVLKGIGGAGSLVAKLCLTLAAPRTIAKSKLLCPWDFPGKNTEVSCHFLLHLRALHWVI